RHRDKTGHHIERLERVFGMHGAEARAVACPAIEGIIEEAEEIAGDIDDDGVMDAALIAAAQAVEHYEITRYGTLIAWARELGRNDCAEVLEETLGEERATDQVLTNLAESRVNMRSAA
ncbi:MAG: ferritin-like domain-containing protein, partial [Parvibaculaceae bacterium]